jgi:hypothetical protein
MWMYNGCQRVDDVSPPAIASAECRQKKRNRQRNGGKSLENLPLEKTAINIGVFGSPSCNQS